MKYFEDIEVGSEASFGSYLVTAEEIRDFSSLYGGVSDLFAMVPQSDSSGVAANPWHVCAMTMSILVDYFTSERQAGLGSPGVDDLRWPTPVYAGDTLRLKVQILSKTPSRSKPLLGSYRSRVEVLNQRDEMVLTFTSIGLIERRPS